MQSQSPVQTRCSGGVHPGQLWQATPPLPHSLTEDPGRQVVPAQQPVQLVPLHTHAPPTQACPDAQAALTPQRQLPLVQLSARSVLQAVQPPPLVPQVARLCALQVVPLQHPEGHDVELH